MKTPTQTPWEKMAQALNRRMTDSRRLEVILALSTEARQMRNHDDDRIISFLESQRCITLNRISRSKRR